MRRNGPGPGPGGPYGGGGYPPRGGPPQGAESPQPYGSYGSTDDEQCDGCRKPGAISCPGSFFCLPCSHTLCASCLSTCLCERGVAPYLECPVIGCCAGSKITSYEGHFSRRVTNTASSRSGSARETTSTIVIDPPRTFTIHTSPIKESPPYHHAHGQSKEKSAMTNTAAAASSFSKRSKSAASGDTEPPAKRSRKVDAGPSWADLPPGIIGHVARFLPMGTPDMMRLLLCVGPRAAAVVRKMYLTGNDYYLWHYWRAYELEQTIEKDRAKECIGFWIRYNERSWKKRCLGKTHEDNIHSFFLTSEEIKSLEFMEQASTSLIYCSEETILENSMLGEAKHDVLLNLAENSDDLLVVSVGDKDIDNGLTILEEFQSSLDKDREICALRFMRGIDALFAYPEKVIGYDLVDVLRFMIEEKIVKPDMWVTSLDEDGNQLKESLLNNALAYKSIDCFRYLMALPGTDINAVSYLCTLNEDGEEDHEKIIHICFNADKIPPSYLEAVIACSGVDLDARNSEGETALCKGCRLEDIGDQTIAKIRLLLEAGADPRIGDNDGDTALSNLLSAIVRATANSNSGLESKLIALRRDIGQKISQLEDDDDDERRSS